MEKMAVEQARLAEEVMQRVAEQFPALAAMVGRPASDGGNSARSSELVALQDHWWVQWRDGLNWADLDAILPDAVPGWALTAARETIGPDPKTSHFVLDGTLCHEVQVRVVIEQWQEGRLRERPVLNQTLRPSQLFGVPVVLSQVAMNWPAELNLDNKDAAARFEAAALAQHEWLPVLTVGPNAITQSSFKDSGDVNEKPVLGRFGGLARGQEAAIGNVGRAFGNLLGGTPKEEPKPQLTAEWIEFEIRSPGRPPRKIRRDIFDLIGPAQRVAGAVKKLDLNEPRRLERALSLLGRTEILPLACQLSIHFVLRLFTQNLLDNQRPILNLLRDGSSANSRELMGLIEKLRPLPHSLYGLAAVRAAWSRARHDYFLASPNVFCLHARIRTNARDGLLVRQSLDIVANELAVRPGPARDPFQARLEQGVVDTNAEATLMSRGPDRAENVAELFAVSRVQAIEWVTVRNLRDPSWRNVDLPADVRARIEQDLTAGYVVIAPRRMISLAEHKHAGWWRVNPVTGDLLGMAESGEGSGSTEWVVLAASLAVGAVYGLHQFLGCGGMRKFAPDVSREKVKACAVGAVIAGFLMAMACYVAFAKAESAFWKFIGGKGGVLLGYVSGGVCNDISGLVK